MFLHAKDTRYHKRRSSHHHLAEQTVRKRSMNPHLHVTPRFELAVGWRDEVQGFVLRCSAKLLSARFISSLNHHFILLIYLLQIAIFLNIALPFH